MLLAGLAAAGALGACESTTGSGPGSDRPSVFEHLFATDLSARDPTRSTQAGDPASDRRGLEIGGQHSGGIQTAVYHGDSRDIVAVAAAERPGEGEFRLNFENAAIGAVVEAILTDALGSNYTIHQGVSGQVTLQTAQPVQRDDLLPILESVLAMNGAVLIRESGVFRIVPETTETHARADYLRARPGRGVSVIPLRYVSAATLAPVLEGFGIRPGAISVDEARNLLLVTGNSQDRRTAVETVLSFDDDWMQDQSVAVVPTQQVAPETIIPELQRVFQSREGGLGRGSIQFMPMSRARAVLVVSRQRDLIERAQTWIHRLDLRDPDVETGVYVYRAKYRDAERLVEILSGIFREPSRQDSFDIAGMDADDDLGFEAGGNGGIRGQAGESIIQLGADTSNNSVVIAADRDTRRKILSALHQIDIAPLQVSINVTIAEIRLGDELRHGIQYFLKHRHDEGSLGLFNTVANQISRELPGFNFLVGSESNPDVIIDAFDSITDVQVLSSPSLMVMENETARLQVGDQIPVTVREAVSVEDPNAPVVNQIEFRDTGIILNVRPRVADNGIVSLEIEQEISSVVGAAGSLTPTISQRSISSTISVMDGQSVMLGGLISEGSDSVRSGIPGLHRINLIGNLFGRTERLSDRTELMILIRPTVIRDGHDARRVAEELRSRLWAGDALRKR